MIKVCFKYVSDKKKIKNLSYKPKPPLLRKFYQKFDLPEKKWLGL